ncbi:MAG: SigB/SigF/SigG family RNA polymerase sigma factor [Eubacteriales bacterium]|nr:SigB/SigF/SigG family RNA polymerase sigma factor [Eubacteriales bacterium]
MPKRAQLTREETQRLILQAQQGDDDAQEQLVKHNIALVRSIIKRYQGRGAEYDDLFQIGSVGLIKAIRNFDVSLGLRFSTYAVPMIAGEIKRFLRDDGMVKVSRSYKELSVKIAAAQEALSAKLGREATIKEVSAYLEVEEESVIMAMEAVRPHLSIYEPAYGEESDATVADKISSQADESEIAVNRVMLKELLRVLEPRERQLIMMRYFMDRTQGEIAGVLGVSQVQVSRLESRILGKLREHAT